MELKDNSFRAKLAITMIFVVMVFEILGIISSYMQYNLLNDALNGELISESTAEANDNRELAVGICYLIVFIISSVTFIQWFRRAYNNLHQLTLNLNYNEGWAAGSWFVPIISLYRPYKMMKEMFTETNATLAKNNKELIKNSAFTIIIIWWILWITNNFIGRAGLKMMLKAETIEDYINATILEMVCSFIGIPLALTAVAVIKRYSNIESTLSNLPLIEELNEGSINPEISLATP